MSEWALGRELWDPGQGRGGDGGRGLDRRRPGLDAGGSDRDVGVKQQGGCQGRWTGVRAIKSQREQASQKASWG